MSKLIGISDIHGEYEKLCALLDKLSPQKNDTIVFMGFLSICGCTYLLFDFYDS